MLGVTPARASAAQPSTASGPSQSNAATPGSWGAAPANPAAGAPAEPEGDAELRRYLGVFWGALERRFAERGPPGPHFTEEVDACGHPGGVDAVRCTPFVPCSPGKRRTLVLGSRFCLNVRRVHQQNTVNIVLHGASGRFYQVCRDPDCRGFQSGLFVLPERFRRDCTESA